MQEIVDLFTRDGNLVSKIARKDCYTLNEGLYHKAIYVIIVNGNKVLLQQRAKTKSISANKWDVSFAGMVQSGETEKQACCREGLEELNIDTAEKDFKLGLTFVKDNFWSLNYAYILEKPIDIKAIRLQKSEVQAVKWVTLSELTELIYSTDFVGHPKEFKDFIINYLHAKEVKNNTII